MPRILHRTLAILLLAGMAFLVAWACYYTFRYGLPTTESAEIREPGLYALGERGLLPLRQSPVFEWSLPYHIGMRRDVIRKALAYPPRLVASASRLDKGWRVLQNDAHGLAYYVTEFENGHRSASVAACDLYQIGERYHVLFFDDAGLLVGVHLSPGVIYTNESLEATAAALLVSKRLGESAASQLGSPKVHSSEHTRS